MYYRRFFLTNHTNILSDTAGHGSYRLLPVESHKVAKTATDTHFPPENHRKRMGEK